MYCPKCSDKFEEGSRRFCPTDGARLVSETPSADQRQEGIFSNLVSKVQQRQERDEILPDVPRFIIKEVPAAAVNLNPRAEDLGDDFFVLEDPEPEPVLDPIFSMPTPEPRPAARKVNPNEIPAGHVELGGGDRLAVSSADFQEDDPEAFIGRTVKGRYLVTDLLGGEEGSYAFLADDKLVADKKVLVRILLVDDDDEILGSILDEERVSLAHVTHPNIARLIDSGQFTDGIRYLISEYVDALSVSEILSIHGMFGVTRAMRIIKQVAAALNEVHQEGILHRDLRPTNIIVMPTGGDSEQVTLVNLGASNGRPTKYNIAYKAPEVLDGRTSTIASDVFSLAVIAYEMLTGQLPFNGNTAKEVMRVQHEGAATPVSVIRPELPRALDAVFQKAFAYEISRRYGKARDLGDALVSALTEPASAPQPIAPVTSRKLVMDTKVPAQPDEPAPEPAPAPAPATPRYEVIAPAVRPDEPAWTRRSPEPPETGNSSKRWLAGVGLAALLMLFAIGWYYVVNHPVEPDIPVDDGTLPPANTVGNNGTSSVQTTEMPPLPRAIPQPPNTNYYQNSKQNLKGDLLRHFVGFTLYYPKDWKVNGPQPGSDTGARGKFLDISSSTPDGKLKEQMLISYYPSKGTYKEDSEKFPLLAKEANETLKKILPGYQVVSEGEIKLNGDWRAYEVKFQAGGESPTGEKIVVWGRRLFIPAARPGVRDGFEITMLATSAAEVVRSVDDVGVRGELGSILWSFEPSQNF